MLVVERHRHELYRNYDLIERVGLFLCIKINSQFPAEFFLNIVLIVWINTNFENSSFNFFYILH